MNNQKVKRIILEYIDKVKEYGIPVKHVLMFGSVVKGKIHLGSDIDICIVSPIFGKDRQKERLILMNLREGVSDLIEPHPYSEKDFQNPYDSLSVEIKRNNLQIL